MKSCIFVTFSAAFKPYLGIIAALAMLVGASAVQAASFCATEKEQHAMNMRAMRSELMVAALACSQKDHYNYFIRMTTQDQKRNGKAIRAYFKRHYGQSSEQHLNKFVTQLANQASRVSLEQSDRQYCKDSLRLFQFVSSANAQQMKDYAKQRYGRWQNIPVCNPHVVAQAE